MNALELQTLRLSLIGNGMSPKAADETIARMEDAEPCGYCGNSECMSRCPEALDARDADREYDARAER